MTAGAALWQLVLVRVLTYYREPGSVFWTFLSPVLLALVLGIAFRGEATAATPGTRYIDFLIPGLIGMGLMSSGLWGVGYSIAQLRMERLVKRLVATPMSRAGFLFSFVVLRASFLLVELPIMLGVGAIAFGVSVRGSLLLLVAVTLLGALVFAGIGLLVASRARSLVSVGGVLNLASLPMYVGSGIFFSSAHFPDAVQPVIRALPLTTLNDTLRAVMLDGAGLAGVLAPMGVLAGWAVVTFVAALALFRWTD